MSKNGKAPRRAGLGRPIGVGAVAALVGIPRRRLLGWLARGVFPRFGAHGRGTRRQFTKLDVYEIAILADLQALFGPHLRPKYIAAEIAALTMLHPRRARPLTRVVLARGEITVVTIDARTLRRRIDAAWPVS